jgi:hypothetical protein
MPDPDSIYHRLRRRLSWSRGAAAPSSTLRLQSVEHFFTVATWDTSHLLLQQKEPRKKRNRTCPVYCIRDRLVIFLPNFEPDQGLKNHENRLSFPLPDRTGNNFLACFFSSKTHSKFKKKIWEKLQK